MQSTMQQGQLGIPLLLRHMMRVTGRSRLYTQSRVEGRTYRELVTHAGRLAAALGQLGIRSGSVVATLCGSTESHLAAYLGIPGIGYVLHTVNVRLHDQQIEYILNDSGCETVICDADQLDRLVAMALRCTAIRHVLVVGAPARGLPDIPGVGVATYEALVDRVEPVVDWADVDERAAAIVCHTSGTTGMPKGVVYSHRSLWLQAASLCMANSLAIGASTRLLPAVPLYHVNGWGLPFAAFMAGADMILPDKSLQAQDILFLIRELQPDLAAGVPTIWHDVLLLLKSQGQQNLGALKAIACGGAQVPADLIRSYAELGVNMYQAWGMTETSSMSAISKLSVSGASSQELANPPSKQGRVSCGLEIRLGAIGSPDVLPSDGHTIGEVQIRGPWVTGCYLGNVEGDNFIDGWLRTGDLGTIDEDGYISLSDRVKDAIKSGGEWIPSIELEKSLRLHPAVQDVAVVGIADPRWQERPAGIIVLKPGCTVRAEELSAWLESRVARWWIPDQWMITRELPRTSVGKIDKKMIRQMIQDGELESGIPDSLLPRN